MGTIEELVFLMKSMEGQVLAVVQHPGVNVICLIPLAFRGSPCLPSLCNSIRVDPENVRASLSLLALCAASLGETGVVWLCQCHGEMLIRLIICISWHQHKCIVLP